MPALLILLGPPLILLMVGVERTHVDAPAAVQVSSGLIFGTVLAIPVLDLVSGRPLRLLFGFATLAPLVSLTAMRAGVARTPRRSFAAGLASGFMGTATGMSGPPLAVVFAHEHGPTVRSTLRVIYGIGSAFSIGALLIARRIATTDLWLAALLTAPVVAGFGAGRLLLNRVSKRFLHLAVLAVVGGCASSCSWEPCNPGRSRRSGTPSWAPRGVTGSSSELSIKPLRSAQAVRLTAG
jgi:uncharacterized membrane protein YfcA